MTAVTREVLDAIRDKRIPQADTELFATFRPWKRTDAEIFVSVTPVNYAYAPGELPRFIANTTPGTTDVATGFQAAIDSASAQYPLVYFSQECGISTPLLIRTTTVSGIGLVGENKAVSIIEPLAANISTLPLNINACIVNQNNNPHLLLQDMRFTSAAAFTGIAIYCEEGGGAGGTGQALFSPVFRNLFVDFPSTNGGFLTGTMQNGVVDSCTFENMKGVFTFKGVGSADNHFANISLYNCYDHFILQTADTNGSYLTTINSLHAYVHNRGRLIDVIAWNGAIIDNVVLEPASGSTDTGLFRFEDCVNLIVTNFIAVARSGVPQCAVGIEIKGSGTTSAKFANGKISAATGLLISSTGTIDLEFENIDFTGCATLAVEISGACTGTLRTRNCKFNDGQLSLIKHSAANSVSWFSEGDEFLNAGLSASAGSRNLDLNTSGVVRIANGRIGQNNGSAAAAFFVAANGSGTVSFIDMQVVGAPPTGFSTGAQALWLDGVEGTWTPTAGGTSTFTSSAWYKIVKNVLYFGGRLTITLIGTGSATTVAGLPYTNGATYYGVGVVPFWQSSVTNLASIGLLVAPSAAAFTFRTVAAGGAASTGTANVLQNGTDVIFSGSYSLA